jgi:hypothetical protein
LQTVDEFLTAQATSLRLRGTLEPGPDASSVKITPWSARGDCGCDASLSVPKDCIKAVVPTGEQHFCCGKLLLVADVEFKPEGREQYARLHELRDNDLDRSRQHCETTCAERYQQCLDGCDPDDGGCFYGCKQRLQSCFRSCTPVLLSFAMQSQEQSNWCWSAVATSTSLFYDTSSGWVQCTVVNDELGQTTCCADGSTTDCNQVWFLERALTRTNNLNTWQAGSLSASAIRSQLSAGRPLGVRIGWSGGGGHFVILHGIDSSSTVTVSDPIYGTSTMSLSTFKTNYQGTGSWTHSYLTRP